MLEDANHPVVAGNRTINMTTKKDLSRVALPRALQLHVSLYLYLGQAMQKPSIEMIGHNPRVEPQFLTIDLAP